MKSLPTRSATWLGFLAAGLLAASSPGQSTNLILPANGGVLVSYTSQYSAGNGAAMLTDNALSLSGSWISQAFPANPQAFVYRFSGGGAAVLSQAVLYNYGQATHNRYSLGFHIDVSNDGTNFTPVVSGVLATNEAAQTFDLASASGKYVRLAVTSGTDPIYWELAEFQVFGTLLAADIVPPVPGTATSPAVTNATPIVVNYSGASDAGSGLASVELWFKAGAAGTWYNSGLAQSGAAGAFNFTGASASNTYYFGLVAVDRAGNRSAAVTGNGQTSTLFTAPPGTNQVTEFWLRTGATTNTMPDGRQVVMWGFARESPPAVATLDNADGAGTVSIIGYWIPSIATPGFWATDYLNDGNADKGTKSVTFTPALWAAGSYEVAIRYPAAVNRATAVPVDIVSAAGTNTVLVNQRINGGSWFVLGTFPFATGTNGFVRIRTTGTTDGYVIADAVRFSAANSGVVTVPGPALSVAAHGPLVIHLRNALPEPVSLAVPGQYGYQGPDPVFHADGPYAGRVRSLAHEAAPLGGTATYTWTDVQPGTFLYHSASHPSIQVQMGLYGSLSVVEPGPAVYGVPFNTSVALLFSEIDPEVHDAVAGSTFGWGPSFVAEDFADAAAFIAQVQGSGDIVAGYVASQLSGDPATLANDLNLIVGGSCIYDPVAFPDTILSDATIEALISAPEVNQPLSGIPYNGYMVRLNRLLLQDGLAAAGIVIPAVHTMTSTIRSYAQYFMVNGQGYTNGAPPIVAGAAGSSILLRLLNAGMDMHVPVLNNAGDLQLIGEDGQPAPYVRNTATVLMPALKTVDAVWTPAAAGTNAVYDRRLGMVNGLQTAGGMLAYLGVSASNVVASAPSILVPPANAIAFIGQSATFSVVASHAGTPTYQWQLGGANIPGATAATYTIASVTSADLGSYTVVVTDGAMNTMSPAALLTVVTQPQPVTAAAGGSATFVVTDLGPAALSYQWQKDGADIPGATSAAYTFVANYETDNGHLYRVTVSGPGGLVVSSPAMLTVTPVAPAIVTQPANQVVPEFATATFTVTATGSGLTYQWARRDGAGPAFLSIAGANAASYAFPASFATDNGAVFHVVVSRSGAAPVTSSNATLTVLPVRPQILTQPMNTTANYGQPTNLSVAARATGPLSYQWQKQNGASWPAVSGTGISGATAASLLFNAAADTNMANNGNYRVVVTSTGQGAASVTSSVASFTIVISAPSIVTQPASLTVAAGLPDVTLTVVGAGFPAPTYQWQRRNNTGVWGNLASAGSFSGVTTPALLVGAGSGNITVALAGSYRVILSNLGGSVTSQVAGLTVVQTFTGSAVSPIPTAGGTASPYPRTSSSIPAFTGSSVQKTTVNLTLTHPEPYDVNVLLTTPGASPARKVEFMAGLGPVQQPHEVVVSNVSVVTLYSYPVTNVNLTFSDAAPAPAPTFYPLYAGTFQPTVTTPVVAFPSPAPGLPYSTMLSGFTGFTQPTAGGWRLFVNDVAQDSPATGPDGRISAWSITLTVGP